MNIINKFKILFFKKDQEVLLNILTESEAYKNYIIAQKIIENEFKQLINQIDKQINKNTNRGVLETRYEIGYNNYKDKSKRNFLKNYYMDKGYIVKFQCFPEYYDNIYCIHLSWDYKSLL